MSNSVVLLQLHGYIVPIFRCYVVQLFSYCTIQLFAFYVIHFSARTQQCAAIDPNGISVTDSSRPFCLELLDNT